MLGRHVALHAPTIKYQWQGSVEDTSLKPLDALPSLGRDLGEMRRKRRSSKDRLRLASAHLEQASVGAPIEVLQELVDPMVKLCKSKMIRRCSACTNLVEETVNVSARLFLEADGHFINECIQYRLAILDEIVKDLMADRQRHKAHNMCLGLHAFKHNEVAIRERKQRLSQASSPSSVASSIISNCTSHHTTIAVTTPAVSAPPSTPSPPTRWTKPLRIVCQGLETIIQGIPVIAPLSIIPSAAAAAADAVNKRHQNNEARDELKERVVEIEALGHFQHLERPLQKFQDISETMDSRHALKRLVHAQSEDHLLSDVDKQVDQGLGVENLSQTIRLHNKLDALKLHTTLNSTILLTGVVFFPETEARSGEISRTLCGVKATFAC